MNKLSNGAWNLIVFLAGILYTLAFAPFDYAYLTPISLIVLSSSWLDTTPFQAAFRGFLFGLAAFGLGVSWVFISIFFYGNASFLASSVLTIIFAMFWALFPALTGYLSVRLALWMPKLHRLILIPFVWVFVEYFRGYWLLNGFPWLQIAYSQLDSPYSGFIPLIGGYGTGFLVLVSVVLCVYLIHFKRRIILISSFISLLLLSGYGFKNIAWTQKSGDGIKITLIQGNISQDKKWKPEFLLKSLLQYQQMTHLHWDSDVIVWPETSIPTYLHNVHEDFLQPLAQEAQKHNTDLIVSGPYQDADSKKTYNSVLTLGRTTGLYHKNHLLPFGEYLPLQPLSGWVFDLVGIYLGEFSAGGDKQALLKAGGHYFATSICYEGAFAQETLNQLPEAAYLVNVTNDAWFGDSFEPYQHLQIARMRALETGRYLARGTNTGITAFVAPNGKVIKHAPLFTTTAISEIIFPMSGMTPYAYLGDATILIGLIVILTVLIICFYGFAFQTRHSHE